MPEGQTALHVLVPEDDYVLPFEYQREAMVLLRRVQTGTALTTVSRTFFDEWKISKNTCTSSRYNSSHRADCQYLVWVCQALSAIREHNLDIVNPNPVRSASGGTQLELHSTSRSYWILSWRSPRTPTI